MEDIRGRSNNIAHSFADLYFAYSECGVKAKDVMELAKKLPMVEFIRLYHMMEEHAEKYYPLEVMTAEKRRRETKKKKSLISEAFLEEPLNGVL